MEQSPSWEANGFSGSQEIHRILWNPKDSLPHSQVPATWPYPEPARSSPYPHTLLPEDHLNIILLSTPGSLMWFLPLRFTHQNPVYTSPLPHTRYMPRPSHSSLFYKPKNIWWGIQIIQLLNMQLPPLPCYLVLPRPKYSPWHPILKHPQPAFLPQCQRPNFTCIQKNTINGYLYK